MTFTIKVDCRPGHSGEAVPDVLRLGRRRVKVVTLLDNWPGSDHHYFKVMAEDGAVYVVRHDLPAQIWELAFYDSGHRPEE